MTMTSAAYTADIQDIDERGSIGPLPGENGVVQVFGDTPLKLGQGIAAVLARFPNVGVFDLTITHHGVESQERED
jgi:hypothetical protein